MAMAKTLLVAMVTVVSLLSFLVISEAKEVSVGDQFGWALGVDYNKWIHTKNLNAGDKLVFKNVNNQLSDMEPVFMVGESEYAICAREPNMGQYRSGNDTVVLNEPGTYYFVSGILSYCASGMKFQVNVK